MRKVQQQIEHLNMDAAPVAVAVADSPRPEGDVIIFTGSFNPPTTAHIAMLKCAQQYARAHQAMQIYAAFSKQTIDKETVERPLLLDRVLLLQEVLTKRLPHAGILLFNRGLYVEQAEALHNSFRKVRRILFLIGYDKIVQILDPYYYDDRDAALRDLFKLAELLVAPRGNGGANELRALLQEPQNNPFAAFIHELPLAATYREVSSTRVRQDSLNSTRDVPQEVRRFMRETRAYAPPLQHTDGSSVDVYAEREQELHQLLASR